MGILATTYNWAGKTSSTFITTLPARLLWSQLLDIPLLFMYLVLYSLMHVSIFPEFQNLETWIFESRQPIRNMDLVMTCFLMRSAGGVRKTSIKEKLIIAVCGSPKHDFSCLHMKMTFFFCCPSSRHSSWNRW